MNPGKKPGRVSRTLRYSLIDGLFASAVIGAVDEYFIPYAIALGASAAQIANLASLPPLLSALFQSQAHTFKDWVGGRRVAMMALAVVQTAALALVPFIPFAAVPNQIGLLLALMIVFRACDGMTIPMLGSLLTEFLPVHRRSTYFGWRSRILGATLVVASVLTGLLLYRSGSRGFSIVFGLAAAFQSVSFFAIRRMHERRPVVPRAGVWERQSDRFVSPNYLKFMFYGGAMAASISLIGPFFPAYLLRDLGLNYLQYTAIIAGTQATSFFMMARWGRHADLAGNLKVIRLASWYLPAIPLLWIVSPSPVYLFIVQIAGAVLWGGYQLCMTNFVYDAVVPGDRLRARALYNTITGVSVFFGAAIGGYLLTVLPPVFGRSFYTLALVSAAARIAAAAALLPGIREVRQNVHDIPHLRLFFRVIKPSVPTPRWVAR